jgi:alpha-1,3/alpha-1,6-mannosyltransferase
VKTVAQPNIAFLRPCLGIGGSERLAIDAAMALQGRGCRVRFFVPGPLSGPQFDEVAHEAVPIDVVRTWWPAHIGGRVRAPLAVMRTLAASRELGHGENGPDLVFCDVVAHVVPFVKRWVRRPVLFYCHFPDALLTPEGSRDSPVYGLYRSPLDRLEAKGLAAADRLVVNSAFTASMLREAFPELAAAAISIVQPGVWIDPRHPPPPPRLGEDDEIVLLSLSRFDPRKNVALAVESLAALRALVPAPLFDRVRLVLAGHYDSDLPEQQRLLDTLLRLAERLGVGGQMTIVFSPTSAERDAWFARCRCVVYTPAAEHFGYVPLEAMAAARPVVAVNHGGPAETVVHNRTGLLCPPTPRAFAEALAHFIENQVAATAFGVAGRQHVSRQFSLDVFGDRLWATASVLMKSRAASEIPVCT